MITRRGSMATERPERYVKQLAGHWSGKGSTEVVDTTTVIRFDTGQVVTMRPEGSSLAIEAAVPDDGDADRFAEVVKSHLERFAQRDELEVVWES